MKIVDLRDCPASGLFYGGRAGQKEGILVDGVPWIAKYPRTTRDLQGKNLPPYTSSPVSEHLGARIYASLGIPVQDRLRVQGLHVSRKAPIRVQGYQERPFRR